MKTLKTDRKITVRRIDEENLLKKAFAIREEVFVQEQQVPREDEYENEEESHHFIAMEEDTACATGRWRETSEGIKIERLAVKKEYRGLGVGSKVLQEILDDIESRKDLRNKKIYLNAQVDAVPLYEKFGFHREGGRFFECNIEHQKMVK